MYNKRPSVVIVNGVNALGLEISKKFGLTSNTVVVGETTNILISKFPKHVSVVDHDLFSSIKLSGIKTIVVLYHDKQDELISAADLVNHAKFLSDIFNIANNNKAKVFVTTSLTASKQFTYAKYTDKDQPYDFPSIQNLIEKLCLENNRKTPTYVLRLGDVFSIEGNNSGIINRMVSDAAINNYIRVDDDGLEKIYPVSVTEISNIIHNLIKSDYKGGVYTISPQDGLTQMALANMCMQFTSHVSHIKFVKSRAKSFLSDPIYENAYKPAPYLDGVSDPSNFEKDLVLIVKNLNVGSFRSESDVPTADEKNKLKKGIARKYIDYIKYGFILIFAIIFVFFIVIPQCFLIINTILLSDGNEIFINNLDKSAINEVGEDARYNQDKAQNLLDALTFGQIIFYLTGDDVKSNRDFLNAELNYFEALSYSKDYNFVAIPDVSRGIIQIKIQNAKTLINEVDKDKLFWSLQDRYEKMKSIINDTKL
ncbi:MAG: hypothetical protein WCJ19_05375 [bacterium]